MSGTLSKTRDGVRAPFREMFRADWREALFIHFRVDAARLQRTVPLKLDVRDGQAYVSLVAFTQARLRPAVGGRFSEWLSKPLASHGFLNVRTYVRRGEERGIYFLSEWIPNALAVLVGPRLYGLPYQWAELNYASDGTGCLTREVACAEGRFSCTATVDTEAPYRPSEPGSEAAFLLERYTAFTFRRGVLRRFRIRHQPWQQQAARVAMGARGLVEAWAGGKPCAAHFSQGAEDVAIGWVERVTDDDEARASNVNARG